MPHPPLDTLLHRGCRAAASPTSGPPNAAQTRALAASALLLAPPQVHHTGIIRSVDSCQPRFRPATRGSNAGIDSSGT
eukprot:363694-Chlamydomonas_euryale.AAC.15